MAGLGRKGKRTVKQEELTSDSEGSYLPSPPSTQSSRSTSASNVSDEKELRRDPLPPLPDNRLFRAPQGPVTGRVSRSCPRCDGPCMRLITRTSNRNNNAGRPFIKCISARCNKFVCWDDEVGTYEGNPLCGCDRPSRQAMSGAAKGRKLYYECVTGDCDFWQAHVDENGVPVTFGGDPADEIARLRL